MIAKKRFRISWQALEFRELVGPALLTNICGCGAVSNGVVQALPGLSLRLFPSRAQAHRCSAFQRCAVTSGDGSFAKPTRSRHTHLQENQSEQEARETGIKAILLLAGACWVGEQGYGNESAAWGFILDFGPELINFSLG